MGEDREGLAELGGFAVEVVMLGGGFGEGEGLGAVAAIFVLKKLVGLGEQRMHVEVRLRGRGGWNSFFRGFVRRRHVESMAVRWGGRK